MDAVAFGAWVLTGVGHGGRRSRAWIVVSYSLEYVMYLGDGANEFRRSSRLMRRLVLLCFLEG